MIGLECHRVRVGGVMLLLLLLLLSSLVLLLKVVVVVVFALGFQWVRDGGEVVLLSMLSCSSCC